MKTELKKTHGYRRPLAKALLVLALAGLAACEQVKDMLDSLTPAPSAQKEAVSQEEKPSAVTATAPRKPPSPEKPAGAVRRDDGHSRPLSSLASMNDKAVEGLLGPPAERIRETSSETWYYRHASCELDIFFFPFVTSGEMRVLDYEARADETILSGEQAESCFADLRTAHEKRATGGSKTRREP